MLHQLPLNLLELIFSYCDGLSLISLNYTCRALNNAVDFIAPWRVKCELLCDNNSLFAVLHFHNTKALSISAGKSGNYFLNFKEDELIRIYGAMTLRLDSPRLIPNSSLAHNADVSKITALHACGRDWLVVGNHFGRTFVYHAPTGRLMKFVYEHSASVVWCSCHCCPDSPSKSPLLSKRECFFNSIISASSDGSIVAVSFTNYLKSHCTSYVVKSPITACYKFGNLLGVGCSNGEVYLLSVLKDTIRSHSLREHTHRIPVQCLVLTQTSLFACFKNEIWTFEISYFDVPCTADFIRRTVVDSDFIGCFLLPKNQFAAISLNKCSIIGLSYPATSHPCSKNDEDAIRFCELGPYYCIQTLSGVHVLTKRIDTGAIEIPSGEFIKDEGLASCTAICLSFGRDGLMLIGVDENYNLYKRAFDWSSIQ